MPQGTRVVDDVRVITQQFQKAVERSRQLESMVTRLETRVRELEASLRARDARIKELEARGTSASPSHQHAGSVPAVASLDSSPITSEPELEETLKRLITKIAMILQAEKCVFLLHDPRTMELFAHSPAFGLTEEQLRTFRIPDSRGISGAVFQTGQPLVVHDLALDERAERWMAEVLQVRNSATVPLTIEKRDDQGRVTDRRTIGVLHVFDKRYGGQFGEEDLHLLGVLSRNAAAVIANAKLLFEVIEEKNKMAATIESLSAGLVLVGTDGRVMLMNASAGAVLGLEGHAHIGKPYTEVIANDQVKEMLRLALAANQEVSQAELTLTFVDPGSGQEHEAAFQIQTALVRGTDSGDLIGVALVFNDISEICSLERMKSAFLSTISHELNTPLTTIRGFISTLREDTKGFYDLKTRQEFYQIVDAECERLSRLIGDLLSLSRIQSTGRLELTLAPVDIAALVERVVETQRAYVSKHTLRADLFPGLPPILGDEAKIEQVLVNLVSNAIKFSPGGGEVLVQVTPEDDGIRVSVRDHGVGIPREELPRIFERFHRLDNRDKRQTYGCGIGLYLVKHLVEAHGGSVSVESEVEKGSLFSFCLPLRPPDAEE